MSSGPANPPAAHDSIIQQNDDAAGGVAHAVNTQPTAATGMTTARGGESGPAVMRLRGGWLTTSTILGAQLALARSEGHDGVQAPFAPHARKVEFRFFGDGNNSQASLIVSYRSRSIASEYNDLDLDGGEARRTSSASYRRKNTRYPPAPSPASRLRVICVRCMSLRVVNPVGAGLEEKARPIRLLDNEVLPRGKERAHEEAQAEGDEDEELPDLAASVCPFTPAHHRATSTSLTVSQASTWSDSAMRTFFARALRSAAAEVRVSADEYLVLPFRLSVYTAQDHIARNVPYPRSKILKARWTILKA
ncbi:hypothetical protein DFH11DRAFT_1878258 [Phellopilus nigrolimitatus]|nr:hypothetical protein DFH11DRAFT_1878258 [Phellopilus nigrolimitatus]